MSEHLRAFCLDIAWRHYGRPYKWGGDDALAGFDCSGFVVELLQSCGIMRHGSDTTADGLRREFLPVQENEAVPGDLVFWLRPDGTARHVEVVVYRGEAGKLFSIGFSGGGSGTEDLEDAIRANAWCKVRPVTYRREPRSYADPWQTVGR